MAVDYISRMLVAGRRADVIAFQKAIYREYPRTVRGKSWTEIVPFSFSALYDVAPGARRISKTIPCDPYDLSAWPMRRLDRRRFEVRYQFHTRDLEMSGFVRELSRARPALTFTLLTWCLDDGSIEVRRTVRGSVSKWLQPARRQEFHWDRAGKKFGKSGDDLYDDDGARDWAERQMLDEALGHWDDAGRVSSAFRPRRYEWWNRPRLRDLDTERTIFLLEYEDELSGAGKPPRRGSRRR